MPFPCSFSWPWQQLLGPGVVGYPPSHPAAKGWDVLRLLEWQQGQQGAEGFSDKPSAGGSAAAAAAEAFTGGAELKVSANIWGATRRAAHSCWPNASPRGRQSSISDTCRHTFRPQVGEGSPALLSRPQLLLPHTDAKESCRTLQACCHTGPC